mmetsp:Transcript_45493/g.128380  ORF Transcript_45493/g.128380 Transcript_45493/m.128380 type:complete len:122 (-) Transcript_45493:60-425(-)
MTPPAFESGQQWDYPNVWAPLLHLFVTALTRPVDTPQPQDEAGGAENTIKYRNKGIQLGSKWLSTLKTGYAESGLFSEKYHATRKGQKGGGGEYASQPGFGWTNGAALDFIHRFGKEIVLD